MIYFHDRKVDRWTFIVVQTILIPILIIVFVLDHLSIYSHSIATQSEFVTEQNKKKIVFLKKKCSDVFDLIIIIIFLLNIATIKSYTKALFSKLRSKSISIELCSLYVERTKYYFISTKTNVFFKWKKTTR